MWYIGQLLQNKQGERVLYAGFDFHKKPCHAYLRLRKDGLLEKFRVEGFAYRHINADPIPIGAFAEELRAGFFGELELRKLDTMMYCKAIITLKQGLRHLQAPVLKTGATK